MSISTTLNNYVNVIQMNGNDSGKSIVNKQYNTPVNIYSDKTIAETLSAQTEVLAGGVLGLVLIITHCHLK